MARLRVRNGRKARGERQRTRESKEGERATLFSLCLAKAGRGGIYTPQVRYVRGSDLNKNSNKELTNIDKLSYSLTGTRWRASARRRHRDNSALTARAALTPQLHLDPLLAYTFSASHTLRYWTLTNKPSDSRAF